MVKATELRIGNILMRKNKFDGLPRVTRIIGMMIFQAEREPDEFEPIELTPEILEKCGFVKMMFKHEIGGRLEPMLQHERADYLYYAPERNRDNVNLFGGRLNITGLTDLHQLQNLYFTLTGEALIVNL